MSKNDFNSRIHLEFPRYYKEKDKIRKKGRYDIAILRKKRFDELFTGEENLLKRPVEVGFELKLNRDSRFRSIINDFRADISAFQNKDTDGNTTIVADSAIIINANVGVRAPLDLSGMRDAINDEIKSKEQTVTVPLLYVYLESYRNKDEKPQEMTITHEQKR